MSSSHFKRDFAELAGIMLGATLALYVFGTLVRVLFGITVCEKGFQRLFLRT